MPRTKGAKNKPKNIAKHNDGWSNVFTFMGTMRDKNEHTTFTRNYRLPDKAIESMYLHDGLSKRIVDLLPHEMTREWFKIDGDREHSIVTYLEDLNTKKSILNALTWSRLYGGAIVVLGIDDGRKMDMPLNENNIKSIDFMHVFDRTEIVYQHDLFYQDPTNPKYGKPEFYRIQPHYAAKGFDVHESRVLRFEGEPVPENLRTEYEGWGPSILESCYTELKQIATAYSSVTNIMSDYVQTIIQIDNLSGMLASGNEDLINKRLDIIDRSRYVGNTIMLDMGESYHKQSSSVSGMDGLFDKLHLKLGAVVNHPQIVLFGDQVAGLQNSGQGNIRMFYDYVASQQHDKLLEPLERLVNLTLLAKDFEGDVSDSWHIVFNPLWQQSNKEIAETRKTMAQADALYLDRGVLTPDEVAQSRFGSESYSMEVDLTEGTDREMPSEDRGLRAASGETEIQTVKTV